MTKTMQAMYQELGLTDWQDAYADQQGQAKRFTPYFFAAQNHNSKFTHIIIRNLGITDDWLNVFLSDQYDKSATILLELVGNAFSQVTLNAEQGFNALKVLDVSHNQELLSVKIEAVLPALEGIYAVDARLHRLHITEHCPRFDQLMIQGKSNQTADLRIHPKHFKGKWPLQIDATGNPLGEELRGYFERYDPTKLGLYFQQILANQITQLKHCKLILIGNTDAGKSSLLDVMMGHKKPRFRGNSTHGINVQRLKIPTANGETPIEFTVLDYGGQDYYHNTHLPFYGDNSVFVLCYGRGQYFHFKNTTQRQSTSEYTYPLDYWLRSIGAMLQLKHGGQTFKTDGVQAYLWHNPDQSDAQQASLAVDQFALSRQFDCLAPRHRAYHTGVLCDVNQAQQYQHHVYTWLQDFLHGREQTYSNLAQKIRKALEADTGWLYSEDDICRLTKKKNTNLSDAQISAMIPALYGTLVLYHHAEQPALLDTTVNVVQTVEPTLMSTSSATPQADTVATRDESATHPDQATNIPKWHIQQVTTSTAWLQCLQDLGGQVVEAETALSSLNDPSLLSTTVLDVDVTEDDLYAWIAAKVKHDTLKDDTSHSAVDRAAWQALLNDITDTGVLSRLYRHLCPASAMKNVESADNLDNDAPSIDKDTDAARRLRLQDVSLLTWSTLNMSARGELNHAAPQVVAFWSDCEKKATDQAEQQSLKQFEQAQEFLLSHRQAFRRDIDQVQLDTLRQYYVSRLDHLTSLIYALLDHRQDGQMKDGYVYPDDVNAWRSVKGLTPNQVDYLLAFMCYHKIVFKSWRTDESGKAIYIAPHYLKNQYSGSERLLFQAFQPSFVEYQLTRFYHPSVFVDVIVQFRDYIQRSAADCNYHYELWRNAAILCESKQNAAMDKDDHSAKPLLLLEFDQGLVLDETLLSKLPAHKQRLDLHPDELSADEKTTIGYRAPCIRLREFVPPQAQGLEEGFKRRVMSYIEARIKGYEHQVLMRAPFGKHAKAAAPLIPQTALQQEVKNIEGQISDVFMVDNQLYRKADFRLFTSLKDRRNMQMKRVFISYSKEDLLDLRQLEIHLEPLKRQGMIATWHCSQLKGGDSWDATIQEHFNRAEVYCLLVSPNSMANNYIVNDELKRAVTRYHNDKTGYRIIPILLDYAHWSVIPELKEFQGIPYKGFPIRSLPNPSLGWHLVAEQIRRLIGSMNRADPDLDLSLETYDLYWKMMRKPQG